MPEVADLVATLRVLVDHSAGGSLARLLTGARLRIVPADLLALHRRARVLARLGGASMVNHFQQLSEADDPTGEAGDSDDDRIDPSLVEALDDLGDKAGLFHCRLSEAGGVRGAIAQTAPPARSAVARSTR